MTAFDQKIKPVIGFVKFLKSTLHLTYKVRI